MYQCDIQICLRFLLTKSLGIPGNRLILVIKHTTGGFQGFFYTATTSVLNIYYKRLVSPKRGTLQYRWPKVGKCLGCVSGCVWKKGKVGQHHGQQPAGLPCTSRANFPANQKAGCSKSLAAPDQWDGKSEWSIDTDGFPPSLFFFSFLIKESQMLQLSSQ